jgi:hypothetical protein
MTGGTHTIGGIWQVDKPVRHGPMVTGLAGHTGTGRQTDVFNRKMKFCILNIMFNTVLYKN